jgi:hypothetical protein
MSDPRRPGLSSDRSVRSLSFIRHLDELRRLVERIDPPVWACDVTSAALSGFDRAVLAPPFHLAVPVERHITRIGHVVHRLRHVERIDTTIVLGIPSLTATRTLIDLARTCTPGVLTVALDSALRDGLTSEDFLHRRIVELRRRGRGGLQSLVDVIAGAEATRGGHSWLERRFLAICAQAGLPRPTTQAVVGKRRNIVVRVDCRFGDVVVELLGYRFHRSKAQMQVDAERMNAMILRGLRPLQFTYDDVAGDPAPMLSVIGRALGIVPAGLVA